MRPVKLAMGNIGGREDAINADRCLICGAQYTREQIIRWPDAAQDEYCRSGLCWRPCQINVFEQDESMCTCDSPCCEADVGVGVINCGSQHCLVHGGVL